MSTYVHAKNVSIVNRDGVIEINGRKFEGRNVTVHGDRIIIDGVDRGSLSDPDETPVVPEKPVRPRQPRTIHYTVSATILIAMIVAVSLVVSLPGAVIMSFAIGMTWASLARGLTKVIR